MEGMYKKYEIMGYVFLIIFFIIIIICGILTFNGTERGTNRGTNNGTDSESGDFGNSGRGDAYGGQMGRASEILESVDGRIAGVQDGLAGIIVYIGQDVGDLRGLADRLRGVAVRVEKMENDLADARDCIRRFLADNDTGTGVELSE